MSVQEAPKIRRAHAVPGGYDRSRVRSAIQQLLSEPRLAQAISSELKRQSSSARHAPKPDDMASSTPTRLRLYKVS